ncbi:hypothetical protein NtB2_00456 [Lactococcus termiticola]|uniref:Uncharacterized protein n=1 Tax=Lactococcus termiticola TaxID=2169526 RepID=A0A2R5HG89_9LACT|nr:hypothetical protein NtB2_00456 [Lactococcus termiticola]
MEFESELEVESEADSLELASFERLSLSDLEADVDSEMEFEILLLSEFEAESLGSLDWLSLDELEADSLILSDVDSLELSDQPGQLDSERQNDPMGALESLDTSAIL